MIQVERAVGRLEEGMSAANKRLDKMDDKLDLLLAWRWKLFGVTAAVGVGVSALFQIVMSVMAHAK